MAYGFEGLEVQGQIATSDELLAGEDFVQSPEIDSGGHDMERGPECSLAPPLRPHLTSVTSQTSHL